MKCYVLMISKIFPQNHKRVGDQTLFEKKIISGVKIHTIRNNYKLWKDRSWKINNKQAYLSLREWTGLPYRSKQKEIMRLHSLFVEPCNFEALNLNELAKNDGLARKDFDDFFRGASKINKLGILHFTKFRYFPKQQQKG